MPAYSLLTQEQLQLAQLVFAKRCVAKEETTCACTRSQHVRCHCMTISPTKISDGISFVIGHVEKPVPMKFASGDSCFAQRAVNITYQKNTRCNAMMRSRLV